VASTEGRMSEIETKLALFSGGTGGLDSWLTGAHRNIILGRLSGLSEAGLSCSLLNQLLALAHEPAVSEGFFRYYWLSQTSHTYDVTRLTDYHQTYSTIDRVVSIDQLAWGLNRFYIDALLYFGTLKRAFLELKNKSFDELQTFYHSRRLDTDRMVHRGVVLPLEPIAHDDRYLIAEMACKSFEPQEDDKGGLLSALQGAWIEHEQKGGGPVKAKTLLDGAFIRSNFGDRQMSLLYAADEILEETVDSKESLIDTYNTVATTFGRARRAALANTTLYLSTANDLDVYVATSMRNRQQFRDIAKTCEFIFSHEAVKPLNLRYFDPTLSAAKGHEDKGLIECLMVKCAKVLVYTAGSSDSYGKDAEAAMALSQGKPVIFLCDEDQRRRFFREIHPLSRLIDFRTGVAVGAMAARSADEAAILLSRIFENTMRYRVEQPKKGYFRLVETLTESTIRVQTNDEFLRDTFWNCYHGPV